MTGLRHAADGRLELPLLGVPARGGPGARACRSTSTGGCSGSATRWRSTSSATAAETLRALIPLLERKERPLLARGDRERGRRVVEADGGRARMQRRDPINPQRVFWELSQRLPDGAILCLRLRLVGELVRARPQAPRGDDGVAVGHPGDDGPGRALRDRREVRPPRPAGDRAGRRRRDADERHRRADHDRQVLAAVERSRG